MIYGHDRVVSGKALRVVVQKMAEHSASFNPLTYAVWYSYATNTNPGLNLVMEDLMLNKIQLNDNVVQRLYFDFINGVVSHDTDKTESISDLLDSIANTTNETSSHASKYHFDIENYRIEMVEASRTGDNSKFDLLTQNIMQETGEFVTNIEYIQSKLLQNQNEILKLNQQLSAVKKETITDPLTKLLNRKGFELKVNQLVTDNTLHSSCLMIFDIDNFKEINDLNGRKAGDLIILTMADYFKNRVRSGEKDLIARDGGSRFFVLLHETSGKLGYKLAKSFQKSLNSALTPYFKYLPNKENQLNESVFPISIGLTECPPKQDITLSIDQADKALIISKKNTGKVVCLDIIPLLQDLMKEIDTIEFKL